MYKRQLKEWGWSGARALKSRADGVGHSTWLISAVGQPPARTVVLGGCILANIKDAVRTEPGKGRKSKQRTEAENTRPATRTKPVAPTQVARRRPGTDPRTWAQVAAGVPAAPVDTSGRTKLWEEAHAKMEARIKNMEARLDAKAAQLEKRMDEEQQHRTEDRSKLDLILAHLQRPACSAAATQAPAVQAASSEPAKKKRKASVHSRERAEEWTTVTMGTEEDKTAALRDGAQEKRGVGRHRKTTASKPRVETTARKRYQRRGNRH